MTYKLVFEDNMYKMYNKNHGGRLITTIHMTTNKLFLVNFLNKDGGSVFVGIENKKGTMAYEAWEIEFLEFEYSSSNGERATTSRIL